MRTRLKLGSKQADVVQNFQSLAMVVSQALGGGGETKKLAPEPKTKAEMVASFHSVFGKK